MKSIKEIQTLLVSELWNNLDNIKSAQPNLTTYNQMLGKVSYVLAGLLWLKIKEKPDWSSNKWIDDSLLTKIDYVNGRISIWGVIIWGINNRTEQWMEPFFFEIELNLNDRLNFIEYNFLYGDINRKEITYEEFKKNRTYWDRDFYSSDKWEPTEREWKYKISSKD